MIGTVRILGVFAFPAGLCTQDRGTSDANATPVEERWNLYYQATSIGQYHGTFDAPYQGPFSLLDQQEAAASLTTTLFFGLRLADNLQFYFDPEIAGGKGLSGVNGLADPPNGEIPRVASATPKPYIARLLPTTSASVPRERPFRAMRTCSEEPGRWFVTQ